MYPHPIPHLQCHANPNSYLTPTHPDANQSLESRGEKEMKQAISIAHKAGLKYKDEDGNVVCTNLLLQGTSTWYLVDSR